MEEIIAMIRQKLADIGLNPDMEFTTKTTIVHFDELPSIGRNVLILPSKGAYYLLYKTESLPTVLEISANNFLFRRTRTRGRVIATDWQFPLLEGQVALYYSNDISAAKSALCYIEITPKSTSIQQ